MQINEINKNDILFNPLTKFDRQWFLLTSGTPDSYNTMTASWGAIGTLWGKSTITAYVRQSRKTFEFMEANELFTVSFFDEKYRGALSFCGSKSGRDYDKAKETVLTPIDFYGSVSFAEAESVFLCKKLYSNDFDINKILSEQAKSFYGHDAIHREYIGEILKIATLKADD